MNRSKACGKKAEKHWKFTVPEDFAKILKVTNKTCG